MFEDHFPAVVMNMRPRPVCPEYVVCIMKRSQTTDGCCRHLDTQTCGRVACGEATVKGTGRYADTAVFVCLSICLCCGCQYNVMLSGCVFNGRFIGKGGGTYRSWPTLK